MIALDALINGARDFQPRNLSDVLSIDPATAAHKIGASVSEYWPIAASGEDLRFDAFVAKVMANPKLWRDRYEYVTHWIPQFLWFGIWLEMGQDRG